MSPEIIENLLRRGDRRTVGKVAEVVEIVCKEVSLFPSLFDLLFHEDSALQMRAADAVVKVAQKNPELLQKYKTRILEEVSLLHQQEVNWHTAQMLGMLHLNKWETKQAIRIAEKFLLDKSSILRTCAMQALCDIAMKNPEYKDVMKEKIEKLMETGTAAMKARGRKLIKIMVVNEH